MRVENNRTHVRNPVVRRHETGRHLCVCRHSKVACVQSFRFVQKGSSTAPCHDCRVAPRARSARSETFGRFPFVGRVKVGATSPPREK